MCTATLTNLRDYLYGTMSAEEALNKFGGVLGRGAAS